MLADRDTEFGEFLDSRAAVMRRTAYLLCGGDWHRAEDLVQETLTKVYVAWPRIRRDGSVDAYSRKTMVRAAIDQSRRAYRRREAVVDELPERGQLQVTVGTAPPDDPPSCDDIDEKFDHCTVETAYGEPMLRATWKSQDGERRNLVMVVLPDGTKVTAVTTNFLRRVVNLASPPDDPPVLDVGELAPLIVKSGFSAR